MKIIAVGRQQAFVSDKDYHRVSVIHWYLSKGKNGRYYARTDHFRRMKNYVRRGHNVSMHRFILSAPKHLFVDHKNGNGLDNTRRNLRLCTNAENSRNRAGVKGSSSKYKGVFWDLSRRKWLVLAKKDYRIYSGGRFTSELKAAKAYNVLAKKLFGKYAKFNEIGG